MLDIVTWKKEMGNCIVTLMGTYAEAMKLSASENAESHGNDLVKLRHVIASYIQQTSVLLHDSPAPDETAAMKSAFATLRTTIAGHQATWSAILVRENPDAYRASLEQLNGRVQEWLAESRKIGIRTA